MKLTPSQLDLLLLLMRGPRDGITDRRVATRLRDKGLARYIPKRDEWQITAAGRHIACSHT